MMLKAFVLCIALLSVGTTVAAQCEASTGAKANSPFEAFGFRLFGEVVAATPDSSVMISPVSAGLALAIAHQGAAGSTRATIARTLGIDSLPSTVSPWLRAVTDQDCVEFAVANALWGRQGVPFMDAYVDGVRETLDARLSSVDFQNDSTANLINTWAAEHTQGKISEVAAPPFDTDLILLITNAVYFKGSWADPFPTENTHPRAFHPSGRDSQQVQMMSRWGEFGHHQATGYRIARVPYQGGRHGMYIVLPDSGVSLATVRARLDNEAWTPLRHPLEMAEFAIILPRFKLEWAGRLNTPLTALGMGEAFDRQRADFSGMVSPEYLRSERNRVAIGKVLQKTFVEVNEEGTEAAAVTGLDAVVVTSVRTVKELPPFIVDRPFLFTIVDDATGTTLFLGQILYLD